MEHPLDKDYLHVRRHTADAAALAIKHLLDKDNLDNVICMYLFRYPDVIHDWDHKFSLKANLGRAKRMASA